MASFNFSTRQMSAKIVYYGPGLCGKTTSLKYIFHHTRSDARGKMVSLATETDRTLFFDLLPLEVGRVGGFHTRIQLYTVPGQVFYNSTRRLVLKGVDGIVFVADSQPAMLPSNVESFRNMEVNLSELGIELAEIPLVLQYNKRDLPEVCSVGELHEALNSGGWPEFETSALAGDGIFEVLREISKLTLVALKKQLEDGVPETLTPPTPHPKLADVAPAAKEAEVTTTAASSGLSEDEIEDRALDRLDVRGGSVLVDAVPDAASDGEAAPVETAAEEKAEPPAAAPEPEVAAAPEAEPQPEPQPQREPEPAAGAEATATHPIAASNGRRSLENALSLALPGQDLARTRNVSLDLQLRDERDRVIHQVRDIQWNLQDVEDLQTVYLQLKIGLEREDA
jgi:mutual gliding-motility protein MglA